MDGIIVCVSCADIQTSKSKSTMALLGIIKTASRGARSARRGKKVIRICCIVMAIVLLYVFRAQVLN